MRHIIVIIALLFSLGNSLCFGASNSPKVNNVSTDLLIIGGGASGVTAGIQAARMGIKTVIIEESPWIGGMLTSAGVSAIDGNYNLPGGLWGEFKSALEKYYGGAEALKSGWVSNVQFEPKVGEKILTDLTKKEKNLKIERNASVVSVNRVKQNWVVKIKDADHQVTVVKSKVMIDATELGDIAKLCGVKYDIGMESRDATHESIAPDSANNIVQDLTYVAVLKDYGKDVSIPKPEGYNLADFACAAENANCTNPKEPDRMWSKEKMITYGELPNHKYMINWPIEGNDYYINLIEMTPEERIHALKAAKNFTLCFLYFIQQELGYKNLGLSDDEFPTADHLPMIPYHRESRRIHGAVRFTLNDIEAPYDQEDELYRTCIAVGDYPVDHHHTRYHGYEDLPRLYFHPIPSYGLPLGVMIPQGVDGLIVAEKSISVSNIANGSTRLQPVVLQIGQAAGALAALSIKEKKPINKVRVREVQNAILNANGYLLPYLDVPVDSAMFKPLQRIGSTGLLKGVGMNVEWSNQTWLRADTLMLASEIQEIQDVYPNFKYAFSQEDTPVKVSEILRIISTIAKAEGIKVNVPKKAREAWNKFNLGIFDINHNITRGEVAVLFDQILDPFNRKQVTIKGQFLK